MTTIHRACRCCVSSAILAVTGVGLTCSVNAQLSFTGLGIRSSGMIGVSNDGSIVGGGSLDAFRWTTATGAVELPNLPDHDSNFGSGVSGNGAVIVGWSSSETAITAFRHTAGEGISALPTLEGATATFAWGVSADGSIVVGDSQPVTGSAQQATRWIGSNDPELLPFLPGGDRSRAQAISADGSTIVGFAYDSDGQQVAVRWSGDEDPVELGTGTDRDVVFSNALGVSADGRFIVGENFIDPEHRSEAFLWSTETGTVGLGLLEGSAYTQATGVSADGSIVIGVGPAEGFVWTPETGMLNLLETLRNSFGLGEQLLDWGGLLPTALSPDGRYIVGTGTHNSESEPWLLDRGANPPPWSSSMTPIPEPSGYALAGAGLVVAMILRRRCTSMSRRGIQVK